MNIDPRLLPLAGLGLLALTSRKGSRARVAPWSQKSPDWTASTEVSDLVTTDAFCARFNPGPEYVDYLLLARIGSAKVDLVQLSTGSVLRSNQAFGTVYDIGFDASGRYVMVSGLEDGKKRFRLYHFETWKELWSSSRVRLAGVTDAILSPDGTQVCLVTSDRAVFYQFDADFNARLVKAMERPSGSRVSYSNFGTRVGFASFDGLEHGPVGGPTSTEGIYAGRACAAWCYRGGEVSYACNYTLSDAPVLRVSQVYHHAKGGGGEVTLVEMTEGLEDVQGITVLGDKLLMTPNGRFGFVASDRMVQICDLARGTSRAIYAEDLGTESFPADIHDFDLSSDGGRLVITTSVGLKIFQAAR